MRLVVLHFSSSLTGLYYICLLSLFLLSLDVFYIFFSYYSWTAACSSCNTRFSSVWGANRQWMTNRTCWCFYFDFSRREAFLLVSTWLIILVSKVFSWYLRLHKYFSYLVNCIFNFGFLFLKRRRRNGRFKKKCPCILYASLKPQVCEKWSRCHLRNIVKDHRDTFSTFPAFKKSAVSNTSHKQNFRCGSHHSENDTAARQ